MAARDMQERVSWTVEDPPPGARLTNVVRAVVSTVATVATLGTTTGARAQPTWTRGEDPDAYVDMGQVHVRGDVPWLPGRPGARHRLRATSRAVLLDDGRGRRVPTQVPLAGTRIVGARPRGAGRPGRHADAPWTLTVAGEGTVVVEGAWLALAWIGLLAGWPEPAGS